MSHPDRLSAQDLSFLHLEDEGATMNIGALVVLDDADDPLPVERLRHLFLARLHRLPRLRQRIEMVARSLARPRLVDDVNFDLEYHLRVAALRAPGGRSELTRAVQRLNQERFDRSRPLWDVTMLTGAADGRTAVLLRAHHAVLDGMSAMELARILFDTRADEPPGLPRPWQPSPPDDDDLLREVLAERLVDDFRSGLSQAIDRLDPVRRIDHEISMIEGLRSFVAAGPKPAFPVGQASSSRPRLSLLDIDARQLRTITRTVGASDHAVALSLTASMLSNYLITIASHHGSFRRSEHIRALVPVARVVKQRNVRLGNHASFVIVDLPTAPMNEVERLRICARSLEEAQRSGQAETSAELLAMSDHLPMRLTKFVTAAVSAQPFVDVVVSYMRGPKRALFLGGRRHLVTFPVLPLGRGIAMMAGITHLGDRWGCSLTTDPGRIELPAFALSGLRRAAESLALSG